MTMARKQHHYSLILLVIVVVAVMVMVLNREWIYDYYRGVTYTPSAEMARIRNDLQLTGQGEFLFNAVQPELNNSDDFNAHCHSMDTEVAVLGCYAGGNVYVYNITDARLEGIRELTTAHELLHVVYARMDEEEKNALKSLLEQVYVDNRAILEEELDTYAEMERFEELYVRAGTEIAKLPEALEQHYGEVFGNQDAVVAYYNQYISVFRELSAELDSLTAELEALNAEINAKSEEFERRAKQLDAEIVSFNSCAEVVGCFASEEEFYARRAELINEQESLEALYNEINGLIDTYNAKVEIYNADVLKSKELHTLINSNAKPQEIE